MWRQASREPRGVPGCQWQGTRPACPCPARPCPALSLASSSQAARAAQLPPSHAAPPAVRGGVETLPRSRVCTPPHRAGRNRPLQNSGSGWGQGKPGLRGGGRPAWRGEQPWPSPGHVAVRAWRGGSGSPETLPHRPFPCKAGGVRGAVTPVGLVDQPPGVLVP